MRSTNACIVLLNLIPASDTKVDLALAYKRRDVGRGKEDEGDGKVLDESDVQAVFATELDVGTFKQVKSGGIEASLW